MGAPDIGPTEDFRITLLIGDPGLHGNIGEELVQQRELVVIYVSLVG
jgi:hypothetical protein